jgi:hypothetical protein
VAARRGRGAPRETQVVVANSRLVDSYTRGSGNHLPVVVTSPKPSLAEQLFAAHRAALQAFFRRRIRSKADAPDLAQEVYLRMLRISDQEAIRNPVLYLYTVANNLVKEHAVLDRRQASGIDIHEAARHEQLEVLPAFEGDLDTAQRAARLRFVRLGVSPQMARKYVMQALTHCRRRMARVG